MERTNITILQVPEEYRNLYEYFRNKIVDFGMGLVDECQYYSTPAAQKLLSCWTMFQAACFAYYTDQEKKADFLVNYIVKDLKLNSVDTPVLPDSPIYPSPPGPDNPDSDTPDEDKKLVTVPRIRVSSGEITEEDAVEKEFECDESVTSIEFLADSDWCHISPDDWNGGDKILKIWVDANESLSARKTEVNMLINGTKTESFNIIQEANPNNLNWN